MEPLETIALVSLVLVIFVLLAAATARWIQDLIESKVEGELHEELEQYDERVHEISERYEAEYRDEIARLNLHAAKAFRLLMAADADVRRLVRLLDYSPDFDDFDESDLQRFFSAHDVPTEERDRLRRLWKRNRRGAIRELETLLGRIRVESALSSWSEAHHYLLSDSLNVSAATRSRSRRLLNLLHDLQFQVENSRDGSDPDDTLREVQDEILETLDELADAVKQYFTRGSPTEELGIPEEVDEAPPEARAAAS